MEEGKVGEECCQYKGQTGHFGTGMEWRFLLVSINRFRYLYIPAHENIHTAVVLIQISSCMLYIGHWPSPVRSCLYWKCGEFSLIALYAMNLQSTTCSLSIYLLSTVMSLILSSFQCKFCLLDYSRVCPMGSVVPVYERYSIPFWEKTQLA